METITIKPELKFTPNSTGLRQVYIRITQNRKHIRKRLNIALKSSQWDGKYGAWVNKSHPEYKFLNTSIQTELTKYEKEFIKLGEETQKIAKEDVFRAVNKVELKKDFLAYWDKLRKEIDNYSNYKGYDNTRRMIVAYAKTDKLEFKDITPEWLKGFEKWMKGRELGNGMMYNKQKHIRKVYNAAIDEKIIAPELYPFGRKRGNYKMPNIKVKTKKIERLIDKELTALFNLQYSSDKQIYYAHYGFMLSFYCAGIRIEDLLTLKWSNIKNGRLEYNMKKGVTGGKYKSFEITPEMEVILNGLKKSNSKSFEYILPFMPTGAEKLENEVYKKLVGSKTSLFNKHLKQIGKDIGTTKKITSHLARHSWAGYVYEQTKDYRLIQQNLDHEDIRVTMNYIGSLTTLENDTVLKNIYIGLKPAA